MAHPAHHAWEPKEVLESQYAAQVPPLAAYQEIPWRPGFLRRAPWLGISALLGTLACTAACPIVLIASNGKPIDSWPSPSRPVQPAVLLSILSAAANALLLVAVREGYTIAWWVKLLRGGNLSDCHRHWAHGSSIWQATVSGRHFGRIAAACLIVAAVAVVDGPLLQRSSTVGLMVSARPAQELTVQVFDGELPSMFSGIYMTRAPAVNALTREFTQIFRSYSGRSEIRLNYTGCAGSCRTAVVGHGWDIGCTYSSTVVNITEVPGVTYNVGLADVSFGATTQPGLIRVTTMYKAIPGRIGPLNTTRCDLRSAIVSYPVEIANGTVVLPRRDSAVNDSVRLLFPKTETAGLGNMPSRLGGISLAAQTLHKSNVSLYFTGIYAIESSGPMAFTYLSPQPNPDGRTTLGTYNMTWIDPMPDILKSIREMTFRSVISVSNSTTRQPNLSGSETVTTAVYVPNYAYLAGAVAAMGLCTLGIAPLFDGWWHLGRAVSMSPLEIARAFQAPITAGSASNVRVSGLLDQIGDRAVLYGALPALALPGYGAPGASAMHHQLPAGAAGVAIADPQSVSSLL